MQKRQRLRYCMKCIKCGKEMPSNEKFYTCICGGMLLPERDEDFIVSDIGRGRAAQAYFDAIRFGPKRKEYPYGSGVFMWKDYLLPGFPKQAVLSLSEGFTDLFEPPQWLKKRLA